MAAQQASGRVASAWSELVAMFSSSGKPLLWRVVITVALGYAIGHASGLALGFERRSVAVGLVAAFVSAAGSMGHWRQSLWMAGWASLVVGVAVVLAVNTTGYPLAAAIGMAAVAFFTSLATAARPVGYLLAMIGSYAHLIAAALGVISVDTADVDLGRGILISLLGDACGLAFVLVWAVALDWRAGLLRKAFPMPPSPWPALARALRHFEAPARDGVRRAVALGAAMYLFQSIGTRDAFWVLFAAFAVLLPNGRSTLVKAIVRVGGTLFGCAALAGVAFLLPRQMAGVIGVGCLLMAVAYAQRSSALCAAWMGAGTAVLAGLAIGQARYWAERRVIDTVLGVLIALVVGYLPWPGDKPHLRPPPELSGS